MLEGLKRNVAKAGVKVAKKKPEIMLGVGIVCIAGGVYYTMSKCTKASEILAQKDKDLEAIAKVREMSDRSEDENENMSIMYSKEDERKDLGKVYVKTGVELLKVYLPGLGAISAGIALIVGSHCVMKGRYDALLAAYNAVSASYKQLKEQMVMDPKDIEEGSKCDNPKPEEFAYSRVFDSTNEHWKSDSDYNYIFIENQERYFNDILKSRGHVFLNEVYEALGFPHTKEGSIVGWVFDTSEGTNAKNYIEFAIYDEQWFMEQDSVYSSIVIDFNPDGVIYDLI